MTNTEAIKILNECRDRGFERTTYTIEEYHTARDMAIKALQEQNCDQCEVGNPCLYCEYEFKAQADGEYISRKSLLEDLYKRDYTKFTHRDFVALVQYQDIVAIPPDHDGCKDCVYQDNPQDAMPCRECKHNYMDKWKARPSAEPREVLYSGDGYADGEMVYDMAECPNCGREFEDGDETWNCNFCPDCGQALKWEGEQE